MALQVWKVTLQRGPRLIPVSPVRYAHHVSGNPPGVALTLKQRLEVTAETQVDQKLHYKVDIGFPQLKQSRSKILDSKISQLKKNKADANLEKLARTGQLSIDLEQVKQDFWKTIGPSQARQVAEHYGIFDHLFGDAYFIPSKKLEIAFTLQDDEEAPVYFGNIIKPAEASKQPKVYYESDPDSLWTLALTNPDGHLLNNEAEYVHWLVGNIPGSDIAKGEEVWDYIRPFPPRGTGYQRLIFILYKQTKIIDFSALKKSKPCLNLSERTFSTYEFYRDRQDVMTPAGLSFFQSDWDKSLTDFFHSALKMKEPVYEYDFAPPYVRPQEWFPIRRSFNRYMDRYRDPKKIAEEFILRKLKNEHPFKPPAPPLRFPNAVYIPKSTPSWLADEMRKSRLGWGRVNDY